MQTYYHIEKENPHRWVEQYADCRTNEPMNPPPSGMVYVLCFIEMSYYNGSEDKYRAIAFSGAPGKFYIHLMEPRWFIVSKALVCAVSSMPFA